MKRLKLWSSVAVSMAFFWSVVPNVAVQAATSVATFTNADLLLGDGSVNQASEPQIRADNDGNFYITSERGLTAGTDAWKSTDGGLTYQYLGMPNALSQSANAGVAPAGGDTDVAVAPVKNANGFYNVYAASLSLADVDVSTSANGGATWTTNYASASVPGDDREWIAAYGANTVYISYHDVTTDNIDVNRSDDAGTTFLQTGEAINTLSNPGVVGATNNNELGNIVVDPHDGTVYQIFSAANGAVENANNDPKHDVYMAVSHDGGQTFTDYTVFNGPSTADYEHQFPNVTLDSAGNVYAVYSDDHNIYYNYSTDQGKTWSQQFQINQAPSVSSVMPWSVGGASGNLGVVWYGTSGTATDGTASAGNLWYVYYSVIQNANTSTPVLNQTQATDVVHQGGVCESGIGCGPNDNRDLFDDFGVAMNPLTGFVSIAYSDDQPSNSSADDRTRYATQTDGLRLK